MKTAIIPMPTLVIKEKIDRSIRVKVTNDCQFSCIFCHNEGTELPIIRTSNRTSILLDPLFESCPPVQNIPIPDIEDIEPSSEENIQFSLQIDTFKQLGYNTIHLTGGEPTLHPKLPLLINYLVKNGFIVKLTSNGQFTEETLIKLFEAGLSSINFSIQSLDPEEFIATQLHEYQSKNAALCAGEAIIKRACDNIIRAKALGLKVKINTVITNPQRDAHRLDTIFAFAEKHAIALSLLPVLSTNQTPESMRLLHKWAFRYAISKGAQYIQTEQAINNSNSTHQFILPNQTPFDIKFIRTYQPELLCSACRHFGKESCTENFYGIRIEYRAGIPFVRLCVQRNDKESLMPLKTFIQTSLRSLTPAASQIH